jgi:hypothetical protein
MNSNESLTDDPWRSTRPLFQELVLHAQFAHLAFQLPKPGPVGDVQRGLVAGMITPISRNPASQSPFLDAKFLGNLSDRT